MTNDLDLDSISGIDGADPNALYLRIRNRTSGDFVWHWISRDMLAAHGLRDLAEHELRRPMI